MKNDIFANFHKFDSEYHFLVFCDMVEERGYPILAQIYRASAPLEGPHNGNDILNIINSNDGSDFFKEVWRELIRAHKDMSEGPIAQHFRC